MTEPVLQNLPIDDLLPYARNAKKHPPEQIAQIAASIKEFGFNAPVLIDGENGIIAGHGRVLAARKLGLDSVPCLVLTHLTPAQKRAYIIADNRLGDSALAPWDWEMLQVEIDQLKEDNYDYTLTGFTEESLAAAVQSVEGGLYGAEDEAPESSTREIDPDDYEMGHRCPRCGFEFDDQQA
jgi:ParB-like chromosome segregation protein Spo0J